jgi:hypothetical protein
MIPYVYQPLNVSREEIRVLTLHPGTGDDAIHISISHVPFQPQPKLAASDIDAAQETLPIGWAACTTLEGNTLYYHYYHHGPSIAATMENSYCSWRHPDDTLELGSSGWNGHSSSNSSSSTLEQLLPDANRLSTSSVSDVHFDALSYVWGSVDQRVDITAVSESSLSSQTFLRLAPNLHLALVHLRRPKEPRLLWIDAICTNREDPVEKSLQIQRMHVIYKHGTTPDPLIVRWSISDSRSNSLTA